MVCSSLSKEFCVFYFEEEKIIPFTENRYRLTKFGEILNFDGRAIKTEVIDGIAHVEFCWVYGFQKYEVGLVVSVTAFNIKIPPRLFDRIEVLYSDKNATNTMPSNLGYRFKGSPLELESVPGFFYIPYYTSYGISVKGDLFSLKRNQTGTWAPTKPVSAKNIKGGYMVAWASKDIGTSTSISRHRAMALVFLKYDTDPSKLVINHKNGIPGHDLLDNLEWTTKKENNIHAINSGLTPNSVVAILVKDLKTGKIEKYMSIAACSRATGVSDGVVRVRLYKTNKKRYSDNIAYKVDDGSAWPELDCFVSSENGYRSTVARNVFTGETFIFSSPSDAGEKTDVWNGAVMKSADTEGKRPINGFIYRYLTDNISWPEYSYKELEMFKCSPLRAAAGVLVKNSLGEEVGFYGNINTAAKVFNISPAEIRRLCNGKKRKDGLVFSFYKLDY